MSFLLKMLLDTFIFAFSPVESLSSDIGDNSQHIGSILQYMIITLW